MYPLSGKNPLSSFWQGLLHDTLSNSCTHPESCHFCDIRLSKNIVVWSALPTGFGDSRHHQGRSCFAGGWHSLSHSQASRQCGRHSGALCFCESSRGCLRNHCDHKIHSEKHLGSSSFKNYLWPNRKNRIYKCSKSGVSKSGGKPMWSDKSVLI